MASHLTNLSSLEGLAPKEINLNEYTLAQERNDERFGLIFFMRSKSSTRTIFVKDRSKALTEEHSREISSRLKITSTCNYILKIYGIKQVPQSDTFQIYFEDFSQDLHTEIARHNTQGTRFAEAELYAMLYSVVAGLDCLQQNNKSHDFIVPMNILKFSKDLYKIHDNFIIAPKSYLYTQALRGNYQRYLAPELLESLNEKKEKPDAYDPHKADIFALGMCILDAGLLSSEGDFINRKLMILDERAIERALKKFGDLYSSAMVQILEDMLFPDPSKRPSPSVLFKRLPGKPLVRGQHLSGKKRKALDQVVNNASPEKQARSRSPRISTIEEQPKRSYIPTQGYTSAGRSSLEEPLRRSYSPENFAHQPQRQSPIRDRIADIARMNVSSSIKNDPVLSQFLKKLAEPGIHIPTRSPPRYENDRILVKSIDPLTNPPTAQFPTRFSPPRTHYADIHTQAREVEVRSLPGPRPLAATMKPIYPSNFLSPKHDERPFTETYKSGLLASAPGYKPRDDQGPLRTYHLESIRNEPRPQVLASPPVAPYYTPIGHQAPPTQYVPAGVNAVKNPPSNTISPHADRYPKTPQSDSKKDNTINLDSSKPKSKIDELIAKALERSSTNLFLSQQVSADLHSNLDGSLGDPDRVEPFRSSFHSSSSQPNALGTIFERPGSEGYLTPMDSKMSDPNQGRLRSQLGGNPLGKESNLIDLVNTKYGSK